MVAHLYFHFGAFLLCYNARVYCSLEAAARREEQAAAHAGTVSTDARAESRLLREELQKCREKVQAAEVGMFWTDCFSFACCFVGRCASIGSKVFGAVKEQLWEANGCQTYSALCAGLLANTID